MKKYFIIFILVFVAWTQCFATEIPPFKPGKVLPFDWSTSKLPEDELQACPIEEQTVNTMGKAIVSNISNVSGNVVILRGKDSNRENLAANSSAELSDGDIVITREPGTKITFTDGSVLTVGYLTSIKYRENEKITKIELIAGKLKILLPSNFLKPIKAKVTAKLESKNKVSAACVRGTEYVMEYDGKTDTAKYYLNEGTLDIVSLKGEKLKLEAGNVASISGDEKIILEEMGSGMWDELNKAVGGVKDIVQEKEKVEPEKEIDLWIVLIIVIAIGYFLYRKFLKAKN